MLKMKMMMMTGVMILFIYSCIPSLLLLACCLTYDMVNYLANTPFLPKFHYDADDYVDGDIDDNDDIYIMMKCMFVTFLHAQIARLLLAPPARSAPTVPTCQLASPTIESLL